MPKPYTVVDPFNGRRPSLAPHRTSAGYYTVSRAAADATAPSKRPHADEPLERVLGVTEREARRIRSRRSTIKGTRIA